MRPAGRAGRGGVNAGFRCALCGHAYALGEVRYTCPACGPDGASRVLPSGVRDPADPAGTGTWRYRPLLPAGTGDPSPDPPVGGTGLLGVLQDVPGTV